MPKAIWKGAVIAQASDSEIEVVEGNLYFPLGAVDQSHLQPSDKITHCHWKGAASYFDVVVDGEINRDAAWTYLKPLDAARQITGRIAFWRGVTVEK